MTTYYSAAVLAGLMPDLALAGVVLCRSGSYTATAELATGAVIQMVPVPKGAKIIEINGTVVGAASGTSIDVGDGGNDDRYIDGFSQGSLGSIFSWSDDGVYGGVGYTYSTADTIDVTAKATLASGAVLKINVLYKMTGTLADET